MSNNQKKLDAIKIILLGNQAVGKTSLINIYCGNKFQSATTSSIGSNFSEATININNNDYQLHLWDTAGQEKFRALNKIFFKNSDIVIFVYDITEEKSFNDLSGFWINYVKEFLGENAIYGILGNKFDLFEERTTVAEKGKELAEENNALFCETSAKETPQVFKKYIHNLVMLYISKCLPKKEQNIKLKEKKEKKNKKHNNKFC